MNFMSHFGRRRWEIAGAAAIPIISALKSDKNSLSPSINNISSPIDADQSTPSPDLLSQRDNSADNNISSRSHYSVAQSINLRSSNHSILSVPADQFVRYYVWDHLGSTRVIMRSYDSAVIERTKYLPFGKPMQSYAKTARDEVHKWAL